MNRLLIHAARLMPRDVLQKPATVQLTNISMPTGDGRWLILPRYIKPEKETQVLLEHLPMPLASQPPPRLTAAHVVLGSPSAEIAW